MRSRLVWPNGQDGRPNGSKKAFEFGRTVYGNWRGSCIKVDRIFSCAAGAVAETGHAANTLAQRKAVGSVGSFTETGYAAYFGSGLGGFSGAFAMTGENAGVEYSRLFSCSTGSVLETGYDCTMSSVAVRHKTHGKSRNGFGLR
jgi:hypothetical protein